LLLAFSFGIWPFSRGRANKKTAAPTKETAVLNRPAQIEPQPMNIRIREGNLTQRYLNNLDSRFPVDAIEPRFVVPD